MFENVPRRLTDELRDKASQFDRESFYWFSAAMVALCYLRKNLTKPETDEFLNFRRTIRGGISWRYTSRVILIGETLFLMRSAPGFAEFCRRLGGRDLRSTYFEAYSARMFFEGGYEIRARPEAGIKREDFDFQAVSENETVNVEVTALTANEFSPQTVENALHQKRKQLPDTNPAMIFCILPESWATTTNLGPILGQLTRRFFESTRRISAVMFVVEMWFDDEKDGPVGHFWIHHACLLHPNPRRPIRSLAFLEETWETGASSIDGPTARRENEFFRWVDSIFADKDATDGAHKEP